MAPSVESEIISNTCLLNCIEKCRCVTIKNENNSDDANNNNETQIIAKGQSVLTTALRTLRWSKTAVPVNDNEVILNQEKCRPIISLSEVAEHDSCNDCWIVLYDRVYDVTDFLHEHPGGSDVILDYAGRDASTAFRGHSKFALNSLEKYEIGELPLKQRIYRCPGLLKCDELPK